jgi:calcineurin-like phosphoesterase family protein
MPKIYFCSDTHFNHSNILKYEEVRRYFIWKKYYKKKLNISWEAFDKWVLDCFEKGDSEQLQLFLNIHDNLIIAQWNNTVSKDDTVWFLGDFCFGKQSNVAKYKERLNGNIRLITGNHDFYSEKVYLAAGFKSVSKYPVILKQHFILSHAPLEVIINDELTKFHNIFGHVHSSKDYLTEATNYTCVCLERWDLKPIKLAIFDSYQEPAFEEYTSLKN